MTADSFAADVAVVGGGMAGLSAAVRAVQLDARPIVLEKGERVGGSMRLSAGLVWTYETLDEAREAVPRGDPELQELVVEGLPDRLAWVAELGVEVLEPPVELPTGDVVTAPTPGAQCGKIDPDEFCETAVAAIEDDTGDGDEGDADRVLTETPMTDLRTDDAGRVTGVDARGPSGPVTVEADAVLLATGGFQGSEELLQAHVTPRVENLWLRANPHSTGDGLQAARDVGATTTAGMDTFYGHNLAAPPAAVGPGNFLQATQYYGPFAVAIDRSGRRFTDEAESDLEHTLAQDTAREAGGRAFYVVDGKIYDDEVFSMGEISTIVERAEELGGTVLRGRSLGDLGAALTEEGVDGDAAVETIREYNEAVRNGEAESLTPPRTDHARPLSTPPFVAVAVQPGITFTMGGLRVDGGMRVVRRAESHSGLVDGERAADLHERAIPGLYAAGADLGGVNNRGYMGGLASALVTGTRAVEVALGERD